jgi:hypothetical protein
LHIGGEDVFAVGRERGIKDCGDGDIKPRGFREFAIFGGVESAFEVVDFGADVDAAS